MGLKLVTVAIASLLAFNAHASTTDWGVHGQLRIGTNLAQPGEINDIYSFSVGAGTNLVSSAVLLGSPGLLNIENGVVKLYRETGVEDALQGSYTFDGTTGSSFHNFSLTLPGVYYYKVEGDATGSFGGYYSLSSQAGPVPEPSSLALMLAGAAVAGGIYRRRTPV